ncbi:hypothetical protein H9N25_12920 [Pedobacter riviphilus]|uniref:Virulence plasmid B protein n=1 Tax=Pedobacter riviphilus TaxID=2766984 RepID=A0ABX6TI06_9SPHI|nr:hypothetical protein [Pedobacter riviphilus]QNR82890.1 hypothetical protein H9N25_12920 [Pedobacter riviphilus]
MNRLFIYIALLIIFGFQAAAQNPGLDFLNKLKKDNPLLYSGFKGAFSVSETGSALYDLPFSVSPGVGGMTPQLSVSYSSSSSSSILGKDGH